MKTLTIFLLAFFYWNQSYGLSYLNTQASPPELENEKDKKELKKASLEKKEVKKEEVEKKVLEKKEVSKKSIQTEKKLAVEKKEVEKKEVKKEEVKKVAVEKKEVKKEEVKKVAVEKKEVKKEEVKKEEIKISVKKDLVEVKSSDQKVQSLQSVEKKESEKPVPSGFNERFLDWPCSSVVQKESCYNFRLKYFKRFESNYSFIYLYNKSDSNFSHRRYELRSPGIAYTAYFWTTPFIAVFGGYHYTMTGSISTQPIHGSSDDYHNMKPYRIRSFKAGLAFRSPVSNLAQSFIVLKFAYRQETMDAKEALGRISLESKSLESALESSIFISEKYRTTLGLNVIYDFVIDEFSKENISSGENAEVYKIGAFIGGDFFVGKLDKIFWKFKASNYTYLYKGSTNVRDPHFGRKIEGVSVSDQYYEFQLGYGITH